METSVRSSLCKTLQSRFQVSITPYRTHVLKNVEVRKAVVHYPRLVVCTMLYRVFGDLVGCTYPRLTKFFTEAHGIHISAIKPAIKLLSTVHQTWP